MDMFEEITPVKLLKDKYKLQAKKEHIIRKIRHQNETNEKEGNNNFPSEIYFHIYHHD